MPDTITAPADATDALLEERGRLYGDVVTTHDRIALVWSGILGSPVTSHEVALMMAGLKLVRADLSPDHEDNLADAHGYVRIAAKIASAKQGQ